MTHTTNQSLVITRSQSQILTIVHGGSGSSTTILTSAHSHTKHTSCHFHISLLYLDTHPTGLQKNRQTTRCNRPRRGRLDAFGPCCEIPGKRGVKRYSPPGSRTLLYRGARSGPKFGCFVRSGYTSRYTSEDSMNTGHRCAI